MRDDLKAALRALRGSPTFTLAALAVLVLGIGATTTIFSIVDGIALRPLPFDEPSRLVAVGERRRGFEGEVARDRGAREAHRMHGLAFGQRVLVE